MAYQETNPSKDSSDVKKDDCLNNRIGVLTRREVEARVLAPIVDALGERFGREEVVKVVTESIIKIAHEQGEEMAASLGGKGSDAFMESLQFWTMDDALELEVLRHTDESLDFNVTRCRYAEMYRELGIPELGAVFSCNRDFALIEGFNPEATLTRTQTIMAGATHCNFRYQFPVKEKPQDAG